MASTNELRASRVQHESDADRVNSTQDVAASKPLRRSGSASSLARSSRRERDRVLAGAAVSVFVCVLALLIVTPLVSGSLFHRDSASEKAADHAQTTAETLASQARQDAHMIRDQAKDVYGRFKEDHDLPNLRERASEYVRDTAAQAKDRAYEAAEYVQAKAQDASQYVKEKAGMAAVPEPSMMDRVKAKVGNILHPSQPQTAEERVKAKISEKAQQAKEYAQDAADRLKGYKDEMMKKKNVNAKLDDTKSYLNQKYEDAKDSHIYASLEEKAQHIKDRVLGKAPEAAAASESLYERAKDKVENAYENIKDSLSSKKEEIHEQSLTDRVKAKIGLSSSSDSAEVQDHSHLTKQEYKNRIRQLAHEAIEDALNQVEDEDRSTLESIVHRVKSVLHFNKQQDYNIKVE